MARFQLGQKPEDESAPCAACALITGLGNPGAEYSGHRHNIGFQVVDALARKHGLRFFRHKRALAYVARGHICDRPVLLSKPQTYMNLSGKAVGRLSRMYEIAAKDILAIYDDLDLPLGRLRLRPEGGSGGHRGMRSIIGIMGTQAFPRLRVGIDRPPGSMDPAAYVLQPFGQSQAPLVTKAIAAAVAAAECWLCAGIVVAMDRYNQLDLESAHDGCCADCRENH